jgi:hypothetical protein
MPLKIKVKRKYRVILNRIDAKLSALSDYMIACEAEAKVWRRVHSTPEWLARAEAVSASPMVTAEARLKHFAGMKPLVEPPARATAVDWNKWLEAMDAKGWRVKGTPTTAAPVPEPKPKSEPVQALAPAPALAPVPTPSPVHPALTELARTKKYHSMYIFAQTGMRPNGIGIAQFRELTGAKTLPKLMAVSLMLRGWHVTTSGDSHSRNVRFHVAPPGDLRPLPGKPITPAVGAPRMEETRKKVEVMMDLVRRPEGATMDEVAAKTGWMPSSSRSRLTSETRRLGMKFTIHSRPEELRKGEPVFRIKG